MKRAWLVACLMFCAAGSRAAEKSEAPAIEKHKTGRYQVESRGVPARLWGQIHTEYATPIAPDVAAAIRGGKLQWISDKNVKHTFEVAAPLKYQAGTPHGVLVYVSPTDNGEPPKHLYPLLGKHRLIAIGANFSGNERAIPMRQGLAVHAVELLRERYDLDPDRIYITGMSGGGRLASHAMIMHSDLFTGGIPLVGTNSLFPVRVVDTTGRESMAPGFWPKPDPQRVARAANESRFAFMTGEKDFNRSFTNTIYKQYASNGFKHTLYLEEPGLGHAVPSIGWFEKALVFLDEPLKEKAKLRYESAKIAEGKKQLGAAMESYGAAVLHGGELEFVADAQTKAQSLREQYRGAVKEIESKIESGDFPAAQKAIAQLRTPWGNAAGDDSKRLNDLLRDARAKAAKK